MYKVVIAEKYDENRFLVEKDKLEKMLEDAYMDGYREGRASHPYYPYYYCTSTAKNSGLDWNKNYTITVGDDASVPFTYTKTAESTNATINK